VVASVGAEKQKLRESRKSEKRARMAWDGALLRWICSVKAGSCETSVDDSTGDLIVYSDGYMLARRSSSACCRSRLSVSDMVILFVRDRDLLGLRAGSLWFIHEMVLYLVRRCPMVMTLDITALARDVSVNGWVGTRHLLTSLLIASL